MWHLKDIISLLIHIIWPNSVERHTDIDIHTHHFVWREICPTTICKCMNHDPQVFWALWMSSAIHQHKIAHLWLVSCHWNLCAMIYKNMSFCKCIIYHMSCACKVLKFGKNTVYLEFPLFFLFTSISHFNILNQLYETISTPLNDRAGFPS